MGFLEKVRGALKGAKDKVVDNSHEIIGSVIPGYDYRHRKNRLTTDLAVRERLSSEMSKSYDTLKEVGTLAHKDDRRDVLDHLKDLTTTIDTFRMEIENAEFGKSSFFKEEEASINDITKMIEFDAKLLDEMEVITKATDLVYDGVLEGKTSDIIIQIRKLKRSVDASRNHFKDRRSFLIGGK